MGAYHGRHTFETFSHRRSCLIRTLNMEALNKIRYPPSSRKKVDWSKFFLLKKFNLGTIGVVAVALLGIIASMVLKVRLPSSGSRLG